MDTYYPFTSQMEHNTNLKHYWKAPLNHSVTKTTSLQHQTIQDTAPSDETSDERTDRFKHPMDT